MKISTNHVVLDFRVGIFATSDGEIRGEGYSRPSPSVESPLRLELDFDEATMLRDQLDAALKEVPCPHCKRLP